MAAVLGWQRCLFLLFSVHCAAAGEPTPPTIPVPECTTLENGYTLPYATVMVKTYPLQHTIGAECHHRSVTECTAMCVEEAECTAVDWNHHASQPWLDCRCWLHMQVLTDSSLKDNANVDQYRKKTVPCQSDIDECTLGTDTCDTNAVCTNTDGSYTCACNDGYDGAGTTSDPVSCTDIDECTLGTDTCDTNAVCTNTDGSYTCACNDGYDGVGTTSDPVSCTDIDECTLGTDTCDTNAVCTNTDGSYTCACNDGYDGAGTTSDPVSCTEPLCSWMVKSNGVQNAEGAKCTTGFNDDKPGCLDLCQGKLDCFAVDWNHSIAPYLNCRCWLHMEVLHDTSLQGNNDVDQFRKTTGLCADMPENAGGERIN